MSFIYLYWYLFQTSHWFFMILIFSYYCPIVMPWLLFPLLSLNLMSSPVRLWKTSALFLTFVFTMHNLSRFEILSSLLLIFFAFSWKAILKHYAYIINLIQTLYLSNYWCYYNTIEFIFVCFFVFSNVSSSLTSESL